VLSLLAPRNLGRLHCSTACAMPGLGLHSGARALNWGSGRCLIAGQAGSLCTPPAKWHRPGTVRDRLEVGRNAGPTVFMFGTDQLRGCTSRWSTDQPATRAAVRRRDVDVVAVLLAGRPHGGRRVPSPPPGRIRACRRARRSAP
jgi:hypothetical protein